MNDYALEIINSNKKVFVITKKNQAGCKVHVRKNWKKRSCKDFRERILDDMNVLEDSPDEKEANLVAKLMINDWKMT